MKNQLFPLSVMCFFFFIACASIAAQNDLPDTQPLNDVVRNWDNGWKEKDARLAVKGYAEDCDWTNAFGDRVQSREELEQLLEHIFSLDFVMAGESREEYADFTFLSDSIALRRSQVVRVGQEWRDGSKMNDRVVNHLRVYRKTGEEWQIVNHLISQAQEKK